MYNVIAHYYDELHRELLADLPFVVELASAENGRVLDCGCGSGRLTLALAKAGLQVVGVDNSDEMLAIAKAQLAEENLGMNCELVSADIRTLSLKDTLFKTAIFSHNTAMHFDTASLRQALVAIHRHLAPNSLLILDLANPFHLATVDTDAEFALEQTLVDGTQQFARWENDFEKQQVKVEWRFDLTDGRSVSAETIYYYPHPHELQMATRAAGFIWETVYGDYDQSKFDEESDRMIILARSESQ